MSFPPRGQLNQLNCSGNNYQGSSQLPSYNRHRPPETQNAQPQWSFSLNHNPPSHNVNNQTCPPYHEIQHVGMSNPPQTNIHFPPPVPLSEFQRSYPNHSVGLPTASFPSNSFIAQLHSMPPSAGAQNFNNGLGQFNRLNFGQNMQTLPKAMNVGNPPPPIGAASTFFSQAQCQLNNQTYSNFPPPKVPFTPHLPQTESSMAKFDNTKSGQVPLLEQWLRSRRKSNKTDKKERQVQKQTPIQIWSFIKDMKVIHELTTTLSNHLSQMSLTVSTADDDTWQAFKSKCDEIKEKMQSSSDVCFDADHLQQIEDKLSKARLKRARLKRIKAAKFEESQLRQQEWDSKSKEINKWQETLRSQIYEENKEKRRKLAADRTLGKVTREIHDATRLIDTMLALEKLRLIRRDAAQKRGDTDIGESREMFQEKITDMTRLVKSQLDCYKEEESKLKEILKSEEEEKNKIERKDKEAKARQLQEEECDKLRSLIFGPSDISPGDPIFPFNQYYRQAELHLPAFLHIRQEWDSFLVPKGTPASSSIPSSWVMPDEPSSSKWATALQ